MATDYTFVVFDSAPHGEILSWIGDVLRNGGFDQGYRVDGDPRTISFTSPSDAMLFRMSFAHCSTLIRSPIAMAA